MSHIEELQACLVLLNEQLRIVSKPIQAYRLSVWIDQVEDEIQSEMMLVDVEEDGREVG